MRRGEVKPAWSLIIFTVSVQASVGLHILRASYGEAIFACGPPTEVETLIAAVRPTVLALLALGVVAAFFHLGRPGAARFAIVNLRSSWLSRELLAIALFAGAASVHYVVERAGIGPSSAAAALDWLTALLGVGVVLAMSGVYMIRTVPLWNSLLTPIGFVATTFLLGAAVLAGLLARAGADQFTEPILSLSALAGSMAFGQIFLTVIHPVRLNSRAGVWYTSARPAYGNLRVVPVARILLACVGSAALTDTMVRHATVAGTLIPMALLLVSELLGRHLFYAMHRRVGL